MISVWFPERSPQYCVLESQVPWTHPSILWSEYCVPWMDLSAVLSRFLVLWAHPSLLCSQSQVTWMQPSVLCWPSLVLWTHSLVLCSHCPDHWMYPSLLWPQFPVLARTQNMGFLSSAVGCMNHLKHTISDMKLLLYSLSPISALRYIPSKCGKDLLSLKLWGL